MYPRTKTTSGPVAGPFGYPKRCDAPVRLEESMYQAIHRLAPDAQYTIFTGDIVEREVWNTTPETNSKDSEFFFSFLFFSIFLLCSLYVYFLFLLYIYINE